MAVYLNFLKRLFTSFLSTFDVVSDLVNSFDFLGYNASLKLKNAVIGDGKNTLNKTLNTESNVCAFNYTTYNEYINNTQHGFYNNVSICTSEGVDVHTIWGALGIFIMFG